MFVGEYLVIGTGDNAGNSAPSAAINGTTLTVATAFEQHPRRPTSR